MYLYISLCTDPGIIMIIFVLVRNNNVLFVTFQCLQTNK